MIFSSDSRLPFVAFCMNLLTCGCSLAQPLAAAPQTNVTIWGTAPSGLVHYKEDAVSLKTTLTSTRGETNLSAVSADGRKVVLRLPTGDWYAKHIDKLANNLYLIDMSSSEPWSFEVIFDLKSMSLREHILCYDPTLSPNHRYLAYRRFYPAHFGVLPTSYNDTMLIYDFQKPILANIDPRSPKGPHFGITPGILTFPSHWDPLSSPPPKPVVTVYTFPSYFIWSPDSRRLLFMYSTELVDDDPNDPGFSAVEDSHFSTFGWVLVDVTSGNPVTLEKTVQTCQPADMGACSVSMLSGSFTADGVNVAYKQDALDKKAHYTFKDFTPSHQ